MQYEILHSCPFRRRLATDVSPRGIYGIACERIASETATLPFVPPLEAPVKPEWEARYPRQNARDDAENDSVSMFVRLDPGIDYTDTAMRASKNYIFSTVYKGR